MDFFPQQTRPYGHGKDGRCAHTNLTHTTSNLKESYSGKELKFKDNICCVVSARLGTYVKCFFFWKKMYFNNFSFSFHFYDLILVKRMEK